MVEVFKYDKIIKYLVIATCTEPLHIGDGDNTDGKVLVHPVDGKPFVQASSISGILRAYYKMAYGDEETDWLFGSEKHEENSIQQESKLRISDGSFPGEDLDIELRPQLKIDPRTGTCDNSDVQGTDRKAGQKFEMEYIGAGTQIEFCIYLFDIESRVKLESVFSAIQCQQVQLGGQKSNGCGCLQIDELKYMEFNMTCEDSRILWMREDELDKDLYEHISLPDRDEKPCPVYAYEITITGKTDGELLVKSMMATGSADQKLYYKNIQNMKEDYIIPGSSLKGAVRGQMERIASYLQVEDIIGDTFGIPAERGKEGKGGNIRFFDTIIGTKEKNDSNRMTHRIHIDKFTGGVMHGGLFTEKNAYGAVTFRIKILDKNQPERSCGLLLLALRDLAAGMVSIGSGRNVGKGFIDVCELKIKSSNGARASISFKTKSFKDEKGIVKKCLGEVKRGKNETLCESD